MDLHDLMPFSLILFKMFSVNAIIGFEMKGVHNVPIPDLYWTSSSESEVTNTRSAFAKLFSYKNDGEEYSTQDSDEEEDSS